MHIYFRKGDLWHPFAIVHRHFFPKVEKVEGRMRNYFISWQHHWSPFAKKFFFTVFTSLLPSFLLSGTWIEPLSSAQDQKGVFCVKASKEAVSTAAVLNPGHSGPWGTLYNVCHRLVVISWGWWYGTGIWWVKAKDAAKHPTRHNTSPSNKEQCSSGLTGAENETPHGPLSWPTSQQELGSKPCSFQATGKDSFNFPFS